MKKAPMTPVEAAVAFRALECSIGKDAQVYVSMRTENSRYLAKKGDEGALTASVYPDGIGRCEHIGYVFADDFDTLLARTAAKWASVRTEREQKTVKDMALRVVSLTYQYGECHESQLRSEFGAEVVKRLAERACEMADEMSARRPFSVIPSAAANGGPEPRRIKEAA